jgi:molybdopterin molybdotransferase
MISIGEARAHILERTWKNAPATVPVAEAVGLVLAEPVTSDVDSPPHDKSLVDGYAVRAADIARRGVELDVLELIVAGQVPTQSVRAGTATQIMTGAPLPAGADAVVMVEHTVRPSAALPGKIRIEADEARAGQHILRRGASIRSGATVLTPGRVLRPADVGLLCEVGCVAVPVRQPPRVAVLATGNELVPPQRTPAPGEIRNSNGPMLCALVRREHAQVVDLGIARDELPALRRLMEQGFACDVLLLSGGVSAGVLDLVPGLLEQSGVERVFHHVRLKPGKPMWFGVRTAGGRRTLVFGLPGNPVSSLVCFELFVAPALRRMLGRDDAVPPLHMATLAQEHPHRSDRPTYVPAVAVRGVDDTLMVTPVRWEGSADQRAVSEANCLAFFPPGECTLAAGERVAIHWFTPFGTVADV